MSRSYEKCILGCTLDYGNRLHSFPEDPIRRAEWLRILGVEDKRKYLKICSKHFSEGNIYGNRTSRFAKPDRNLHPVIERASNIERHGDVNNSKETSSSTEKGTKRKNFNCKSFQLVRTFFLPIKQTFKRRKYISLPKRVIIRKHVSLPIKQEQLNLDWDITDIHYAEEDVAEEEVTTQNDITEEPIKVEDFEMSTGTSKDAILKGRYIQLKDYLVVSYTTPTTLRLKQKVNELSVKCDKQAKEIKLIKSYNLSLSKAVLKYKKLAKQLKNLNKKKKIK